MRLDDQDPDLRIELRKAFQNANDVDRALEIVADNLRNMGGVVDIMGALLMLSDTEHLPSPEVLDLLRESLEHRLAETKNPALREILGATLALQYDEQDLQAVKAEAEEVAWSGRNDPQLLNMASRVQFAAGRQVDAIRSLETAISLGESPYRWLEQLEKYRDAAPGFVSYASIDDFLEAGDSVRSG